VLDFIEAACGQHARVATSLESFMTSKKTTSLARDPAWLEGQYDNRRRVPAFAQHVEHWRLGSAQARRQLACRLDIPLPSDATLALDVLPAARPHAPVLVFIHGG